jgi:Zn-dependent M32 family carboxypeptidase
MHIEPPNTRLASFRDFAKHYLMIVLSILTALGLEAWIEHAHHAQAAATASTQIEAEIRGNLDEVDAAVQQDNRQLQKLDKIRDTVIHDLKVHAPDDVTRQHILALASDDFDLNLHFPTMRHEAWDVAVANQSASWMERERMQHYSAAYASMRDSLDMMREDTAILMNGTGMVDTIADLSTGDVQPRQFLHVVSQMRAMIGQTTQNLRLLEKPLQAALPPASQSRSETAAHA